MTSHPWTVAEPWDYVLSTGRQVRANHGYIGLTQRSAFAVSEGYDGVIDFGDALGDLEEFASEVWTVAERLELADFMIARWTEFRETLKENANRPAVESSR